MSLRLPPLSHPARELFDVSYVAEICAPGKRLSLPTLRDAKVAAANAFSDDPALRAVHTVVYRSDGRITLERFGPMGGRKTVWNFGNPSIRAICVDHAATF